MARALRRRVRATRRLRAGAARAVAAGAGWNFETDTTLIRILAHNARSYPGQTAMREKDKGIWQQTSWAQMLETVLGCAAGLEALGFGAGDAMLVLGDNRPRLYMGMLAAGALGGYAMPVYPDATPDEIRHVAHEVRLRFVLAEDQEQVDKILELREHGTSVEHIVYDDARGVAGYPDAGLHFVGGAADARRRTAAARAGPARSAGRARAAAMARSSSCIRRAPPASPRASC